MASIDKRKGSWRAQVRRSRAARRPAISLTEADAAYYASLEKAAIAADSNQTASGVTGAVQSLELGAVT